MAGLARDSRVRTHIVVMRLDLVAPLAGLLPQIVWDPQGLGLFDGCATVVAQITESGRDENGAQARRKGDADETDGEESDDVAPGRDELKGVFVSRFLRGPAQQPCRQEQDQGTQWGDRLDAEDRFAVENIGPAHSEDGEDQNQVEEKHELDQTGGTHLRHSHLQGVHIPTAVSAPQRGASLRKKNGLAIRTLLAVDQL